jgi:16S rRNA (guanine527-N7)-methyltransferase
MKDAEKKDLLLRGARALGIELDDARLDAFMTFMAELKKWNRQINLTAITDDREIIVRHFVDSLIPARLIRPNETLLDMGAGGGFPGIPIKIALGDSLAKLTLMDSIEKKVMFMRHAIRTLGLKNTDAVWARAEDRAIIVRFSGSFDIVVSRAFSELDLFLELALPYIKTGGRAIAIKGPQGRELKGAIEAVKNNGRFGSLRLVVAEEVKVPLSDRRTTLVIYEKSPA